jgi:hypothetical protein
MFPSVWWNPPLTVALTIQPKENAGTGVISMNRRTKRRIEVQSLPDTTSLKVILAILLLSIAACGATIASTFSGG